MFPPGWAEKRSCQLSPPSLYHSPTMMGTTPASGSLQQQEQSRHPGSQSGSQLDHQDFQAAQNSSQHVSRSGEDDDQQQSQPPHSRFLSDTEFFQAVQQGSGRHHDSYNAELTNEQNDQDQVAVEAEHALTTLFGTSVSAEDVDVDDGGQFELLDPTLASMAQQQQSNSASPADADSPGEIKPSSSTTNPQVKRKATTRANMLTRGGACDFCKRRKLKCSAEEPSCAACLRAGKECVYSQKKQKSRVKVLEDKLADLERKLVLKAGSLPADLDSGTASAGPSLQADQSRDFVSGATAPKALQEVSSLGTSLDSAPFVYGSHEFQGLSYDVPAVYSAPAFPSYTSNSVVPKGGIDAMGTRPEPDLMTLADAAAGSSSRTSGGEGNKIEHRTWDRLSSEEIAKEIVNAVEGGKGIGEQIVSHLLGIYLSAGPIFCLTHVIPAETLLSRLSGRTSPKPHPTLLLSVLGALLPYSPSTCLSAPHNASAIFSFLLGPARAHAANAVAFPDGRMLDVVIGDLIRANQLYQQSRFLAGWGEAASGGAFAWAAGLGKLGGVGEKFVDPQLTSTGAREVERKARLEREAKLRQVMFKGQTIEPPRTVQELANRIIIFWYIYIQDSCAAMGWGWPTSFSNIEITTPLPREDYDKAEVLYDTRTISGFLNPASPPSHDDTDFCALVKGQTLCYEAFRLFDQPPQYATKQRTADLLTVSKRHLASLRPIEPTLSGGFAVQQGLWNEAWMATLGAMVFLHAKNEVDADEGEGHAHQILAIGAARKITEQLTMAYLGGDMELEGMTLCAVNVWLVVGGYIFRLYRRLVNPDHRPNSSDSTRPGEIKQIGEELIKACRIVGKRMRFADASAQLLENVLLGQDVKMGEWARPDNVG